MKITDIIDKNNFNFSCIYKWTNLINNKIYIGQTQNFYDRMMQYKRGLDKHRVIGKAIQKYGFNNFDIDIIEKNVPINLLDCREQYWMDFYKSYNSDVGYNICKEAGTTRGFHHSEDTKKIMSDKRKQFCVEHPNYMRGSNNPNYGKKYSEERRKQISQRLIGNQYAKGSTWKMSEESKQKISNALKGKQNCLGRKLSQEHKNKIADSNRKRIISEQTRIKLSLSHIGKSTKKVICVNTSIIYNSLKEAAQDTNCKENGISACCRNKQKTCGGYSWKYYVE